MKTREDMIERLVEHRVDCFDSRELADLFRDGFRGYEEMSDEELKDHYKYHFGEAVWTAFI